MSDEPTTYTHPETGETTEIPEGATITYTKGGEITGWSNPPETPEGELHPSQVEDYEPKVGRMTLTRRVLAFITEEDHLGRGPRNTADRLSQDMSEDPFTAYDGDTDELADELDVLVAEGLIEENDGVYSVTEAGTVELNH